MLAFLHHDNQTLPEGFEYWIEAARLGSLNDLGRALEACRAYLMMIAESELGSSIRPKAGASDVVQESLLDGSHGFGGFRGQTGQEFLVWLRQILRYNLADLGRRHRIAECRAVGRETTLIAHPVDPRPTAPVDRLAAKERIDRMHTLIDSLPPNVRAVIDWRHRDGLGWEEIGNRLGKSAEAARKVWFRAIELLRHDLGDEYDDLG